MADAWAGSWGTSWGSSWGGTTPEYEHVGAGRDLCQRCGLEYRLSQLHREWTGLRVCDPCFDRRHPQDYVRGVHDSQGVRPDVRPDPEPYYLSTNEVTANSL